MRRAAMMLAAAALALSGCREADGPTGPGGGRSRLFVTSDPVGASIFIGGMDTGQRTPDTLRLPRGDHELSIRRDSGGYTYRFDALLRITEPDSVWRLHTTLALQCSIEDPEPCYATSRTYRQAAGMRFATTAFGSPFFWNGTGGGVFSPSGSSDSYVSSGMPVIAGMINGGPVALGVYDQAFLAGLPAPQTLHSGGRLTYTQHMWIVPPVHSLIRQTTVRGVEVRQELVAVDDLTGVVIVKLTFRNVTDRPDYFTYARRLPDTPLTITNAYIGFALDPDIGQADDDWLSYDAAQESVFAYDARLQEPSFSAGAAARPSLVGLRVLSRPAGTEVRLNGYANQVSWSGDWYAGTASETNGYLMLTGEAPYEPAHGDARIGHLPPQAGDVRMMVTAGPLELGPGAEAQIVVALAVAEPAAGTFDSGTLLAPGEPLDAARALYAVAARLREKLAAATALLN